MPPISITLEAASDDPKANVSSRVENQPLTQSLHQPLPPSLPPPISGGPKWTTRPPVPLQAPANYNSHPIAMSTETQSTPTSSPRLPPDQSSMMAFVGDGVSSQTHPQQTAHAQPRGRPGQADVTLSPSIRPRFNSTVVSAGQQPANLRRVPASYISAMRNQGQKDPSQNSMPIHRSAGTPAGTALYASTKLIAANFQDVDPTPPREANHVRSAYQLPPPTSGGHPVWSPGLSNSYRQMATQSVRINTQYDAKRSYESIVCEPIQANYMTYLAPTMSPMDADRGDTMPRDIPRQIQYPSAMVSQLGKVSYRPREFRQVQPLGVFKTEPGKEAQVLGYWDGRNSMVDNRYVVKGIPHGRSGGVQPVYVYPSHHQQVTLSAHPGVWGEDSVSKKMKVSDLTSEGVKGTAPCRKSNSPSGVVTSDDSSSSLAGRSTSPDQSSLKPEMNDKSMPTPTMSSELLNRPMHQVPNLVVKHEAGRLVQQEWKPYELIHMWKNGSTERKNKKMAKSEKPVRGKTKTGWRHWTQPENVKLWNLTAVYRSKRRYVQWKDVQRQYTTWTQENDYPTRSAKSLTTHYNDQLKKRKYRDRRGISQP